MKSKTKEALIDFKDKSVIQFKRMFFRTLALVVLTALALASADWLVELGMTDRFSLVRRFPEFIPMILAAAKFTFIEVSLLWIRICVQSVQQRKRGEDLKYVDATPLTVCVMQVCRLLEWMFRVCVFIYLMG